MKNRVLRVVVLGLVVASLAGCGTKTGATEQGSESSSAIVADEKEDTVEEAEDTAEDTGAFAGAEDENIVLYSEIAEYGEYMPLYDDTFEPVSNTFIASGNLPVYNVDGIEVGYIKEGSTITFTGYASNAWARFENPIEGTDYDYLYGFKEYADVPDTDQITVTASDVKQRIIDGITGLEVTDYTFLDTPTSDMEVFEFRIESVFDDEVDFNFWYSRCTEDGNIALSNYMTYCIECEEDTDGWISCKVYYKDEIPEDVWNQHYYGN